MSKKIYTARSELLDHLKYLVGYEDANKMINEYKEEVLKEKENEIKEEINLENYKNKIIEAVNEIPSCHFKTQQFPSKGKPIFKSTKMVSVDEVTEIINEVMKIDTRSNV